MGKEQISKDKILNEIEQKPNEIFSIIKNENYKSRFDYGRKEDGTLYWKIEKIFK